MTLFFIFMQNNYQHKKEAANFGSLIMEVKEFLFP